MALFLAQVVDAKAQVTKGLQDSTFADSTTIDSSSLSNTDTVRLIDSLGNEIQYADSLNDSITTAPKKRISTLDQEVNYQSADSMVVDLKSQRVFLYGDAVTTYGDITLKADYIEIALNKSELHATGLPDSTGAIAGEPLFTQGDQKFDAAEMRYNFKSKRGISKQVKTQESGGYLHGETVKRDTGEIIYIKSGKFTTCEYDDPHFHIHANKLKVIPKDKIITGPAYVTIAGIPTPLALPFGFFPNNEKRANGLLLPTWSDARNQGFGLLGGGYYFGVGDNMDFAITGDIYSRGGYAGYLTSNYAKRYKYRGGYRLNYTNTVFSEQGYPDFYSARTFNINWNHAQDAKARPGSTFSATIDAGSSKAYRNNFNSNTTDFLKSQMNSNIKYQKVFANSPFTLGVSASSSQNTQNSFVSIRAPQAVLTMARIFPFKPDAPVSSTSFISRAGIDKIGIQGTAEFANRLEGQEDTLFNNYNNQVFKNMQNGVKVNGTASTSIKLLKYITLSPATTHRLVGYRKTYRERWNEDSARVESFYVNGLDGFYDGSASASLSTIVYGTYTFKSKVVKAMRHQVTPNASISYRPDYSKPVWGYFNTVQSDTLGNTKLYSLYDNGVFSDRPSAQENGVVNLGFNNTLELKVRDRSDSTGTGKDKKLRLIDALSFNTNYNLAKDSLKWNPINIAFRTSIVPGLQLNASAVLNPYALSVNNRQVNEFQFEQDGRLGRWTNANVSLGYNIRPGGNKKMKNTNTQNNGAQDNMDQGMIDPMLGYYTDFIDFSLPWNMDIRYNITYSKPGATHTVNQVLDLSGQVQLTRNWQIGYRTGLDVVKQQVTQSSFDIYRDLHCWEFSLRVIPFGIRQSYNFEIKVKPGMLEALKVPRNRQFNRPDR